MRDFNSISPSAKGLLLTKAQTTISFARKAAGIVWEQEELQTRLDTPVTKEAWILILHFENRYRTIDKLLFPLQTNNVLEIASGFSFRGLQLCTEAAVTYIDTDLPESSFVKQQVVQQIQTAEQLTLKGKLLTEPLNVLDREAFHKVIDLFPPGPVTIINEGLLMYLDDAEKLQACRNIHEVLKQRGGSWITGDIYIKPAEDKQQKRILSESLEQFRKEHKIDEKKFDNYEQAEAFFISCGFTITERTTEAADQLSALSLIPGVNVPPDVVKGWFQQRQTWKLEV